MSNKTKTIQACKDLAEKYRNPQGHQFFSIYNCGLCKLNHDLNCIGCPLADMGGDPGCADFNSNINAQRYYRRVKIYSRDQRTYVYPHHKKTSVTFIRRADFFEKIIPILEKIPAKRFTKSGWAFFNELDRNW